MYVESTLWMQQEEYANIEKRGAPYSFVRYLSGVNGVIGLTLESSNYVLQRFRDDDKRRIKHLLTFSQPEVAAHGTGGNGGIGKTKVDMALHTLIFNISVNIYITLEICPVECEISAHHMTLPQPNATRNRKILFHRYTNIVECSLS